MYKHLLVPTDRSDLSIEAARQAVATAAALGARITFVHALPTPTVLNYINLATPNLDTNPSLMTTGEIRNRMEALAETHLATLGQLAADAKVAFNTEKVIHEHPYQVILDAANRHGCDLIFMASHGHRGLEALLLGSETQKVLTHGSLPVLVWRSGEQAPARR